MTTHQLRTRYVSRYKLVSHGRWAERHGKNATLSAIRLGDGQGGASSDSCSLELNDNDGRLRLPQPGGKVSVRLEGVKVFTGVVDSAKFSGSRASGRVINVSAKGFDIAGRAKEPQLVHQDDGTVGDFLKKLGEKAGFKTKIDPALANIASDYFVADGESFLHMGEKLARELGGTFKLRGEEAVLARMGKTSVCQRLPGCSRRAAAAT
ncbi:MAG: hypothetical protein ABJQ71_05985 [Roseibium sp.]